MARYAAGDRALGDAPSSSGEAGLVLLARVDHAVSLTTRAAETLTGEVDSARCVGHLARLVGDLAPYRRRPTVRQLTAH